MIPVGGAIAASWHHGPVLEVANGMIGWVANGFPLEKGEGEAVSPEISCLPDERNVGVPAGRSGV